MTAPTKFTGTGFSPTALSLDYLRDEEGNPKQTPNSFTILHNPVRAKMNELLDYLSALIQDARIHLHPNKSVLDDLSSDSGNLVFNGFIVGDTDTSVDGGFIGDIYTTEISVVDGGSF